MEIINTHLYLNEYNTLLIINQFTLCWSYICVVHIFVGCPSYSTEKKFKESGWGDMKTSLKLKN